MLLTRLLNACHHFPGFVYAGARLCEASQAIEIDVRPRLGSRPRCSGCGQPASGYDHLGCRRFEFIPVWGYAVFLLYRMRRVDCQRCGVNRVWTSGITYLWTDEGWLYLAIVIDLFNREVAGWPLKPRMAAGMVADAPTMAWFRRKPAAGLIHHSDRGSQLPATPSRQS